MRYWMDYSKLGFRIYDDFKQLLATLPEVEIEVPSRLVFGDSPEGSSQHGWLTAEGWLSADEDIAIISARI